MDQQTVEDCRYFVSYSGVKLPFKLVDPIEAGALSNRNTFFKAFYSPDGVLSGFDKMVYGEVELSHRYQYHGNGALHRAEIVMDEDTTVLTFDEAGEAVPTR